MLSVHLPLLMVEGGRDSVGGIPEVLLWVREHLPPLLQWIYLDLHRDIAGTCPSRPGKADKPGKQDGILLMPVLLIEPPS